MSTNNLLLLLLSGALLYVAYKIPSTHEQPKKQTNLVFYIHDDFTGEEPSAITVAGKEGAGSNVLKFGTVSVLDDPVTEGPSLESKLIGKAQGTFITCQRDGRVGLMVLSVVFTDGEYKGSSLEIQGLDIFALKVRELGVVSGTGQFRFVKGYALLETESLNLVPDLMVVLKLNVTVKHY